MRPTPGPARASPTASRNSRTCCIPTRCRARAALARTGLRTEPRLRPFLPCSAGDGPRGTGQPAGAAGEGHDDGSLRAGHAHHGSPPRQLRLRPEGARHRRDPRQRVGRHRRSCGASSTMPSRAACGSGSCPTSTRTARSPTHAGTPSASTSTATSPGAGARARPSARRSMRASARTRSPRRASPTASSCGCAPTSRSGSTSRRRSSTLDRQQVDRGALRPARRPAAAQARAVPRQRDDLAGASLPGSHRVRGRVAGGHAKTRARRARTRERCSRSPRGDTMLASKQVLETVAHEDAGTT